MSFRHVFLILLSSVFPLLATAERPNVIVILTDDQGWGDLSIHGNTNISTPNIDRPINVGRADVGIAVDAEIAPALIVGENDDDVGAFGGGQ